MSGRVIYQLRLIGRDMDTIDKAEQCIQIGVSDLFWQCAAGFAKLTLDEPNNEVGRTTFIATVLQSLCEALVVVLSGD